MKIYKILFTNIFLILLPLFSQAQQVKHKASYYNNKFHGRKMSNGELYNRNDFTCAHRTLPFGTRLKVTNIKNGKEVIVRVTDRGPFTKGRIIDLSYAAAKQIDMVSNGVTYIKIEVLQKENEIPYTAEENIPQVIPEIEYGFAGVCYEFMTEWKNKPQEEKPKNIKRKVKTYLGNKKQDNKTELPKMTNNKYQGRSKTWTKFFKDIKNGLLGIFK